MKKIVFSLITLAVIAQAEKLPYKVFVETYAEPNDAEVKATYQKVKDALSDFEEANVVDRPSNQYRVIVVETIMEKERLNKLVSIIRSMPGHSDAFYLPAPELLKNGNNAPTQEEVNAIDQEEVVVTEPQPIEQTEPTQPQNTTDVKAVSLNQAIDSLLTTNPKIQERIYNYMETGKDLDIADKGYYPTLDLTGSATLGRDRATIGSKNAQNDKWHRNFTKQAELRLVENLYNGGSTSSNIKQAKSRMTNASYLVLERADRLVLETVSAYLNVFKEKELLNLAADNIKTHEDIYDQIKERANSGFGRTSEEQQAGSRLTLARSNFIAQQNAYDDALTTFRKLTNLQVNGDELTYPEFLISLPENMDTIEEKAMYCNPSVRAEVANVELAKNIYENTNAAFLPKIDLEAYASIRDTDNYSYDGQRIDSYGALLRLNYNLFNKGMDSATREKRQIAVQKEQQVLDTIKQDLRESLKFSWQSYVLTDKKLGYLQEHANFSKDTLDSYKEEFKIGRRDLINVLDAENEYNSAQKEIINAKKDYTYAQYRLLDNMGLLTDSFKADFGKKYVQDACSIEENLQ